MAPSPGTRASTLLKALTPMPPARRAITIGWVQHSVMRQDGFPGHWTSGVFNTNRRAGRTGTGLTQTGHAALVRTPENNTGVPHWDARYRPARAALSAGRCVFKCHVARLQISFATIAVFLTNPARAIALIRAAATGAGLAQDSWCGPSVAADHPLPARADDGNRSRAQDWVALNHGNLDNRSFAVVVAIVVLLVVVPVAREGTSHD